MKLVKRTRHGVVALLALAALAAAPGGLVASAAAAQLPPAVAAIAGKAKTEGAVAIFVSTDARAGDQARAMADALAADTGVRLIISFVSGPPDPIYVNQMIREHAAGVAPKIDLIATAPEIVQQMSKAGLIAPVDWAALGVVAADYAPQFHAVHIAEFARPIIYNTQLVKPDEVPHSVQDLLNPRWRGQIVAAPIAALFSPWAISLGGDGVVDFVQKLMQDQALVFAPAPTAIRTQVASGQYALGFGIRIGKEQVAAHAPIAYAPIKAPVVPRLGVVVAGAPKPAAATLVAWWMNATDGGRRAASDILDWPRSTTPGTDLYELAQKTGGLATAPVSWWTDEFPAIDKRVDQVLRGR